MKITYLKQTLSGKLVRPALYLIFFAILFAGSLLFRKELSAGVSFGIGYSLNVLIPSLFPLMFLSSLISFSSFSGTIATLFSPVTRYCFKLPGEAALPILFGLTCGYPVGAKLTSALLKEGKITAEEAGRLLMFVVNPGIAFSVLFVGGVIFRDLLLGLYLFIATALASILLGILSGIKKPVPPKRRVERTARPLLTAVDLAAKSTLSASCNMCLYLVIFSAYLPLLHSMGVFQWAVRTLTNPFFTGPETAAILSFFGEVVHGVNDATVLAAGLKIFALGLSFGGLCIHLQVFSFFQRTAVSLKSFYLGRLLHGALSYGILSVILALFPRAESVFASFSNYTPAFSSGTVTGSVCLLLLSCTYIYLNKGVEKIKKIW